MHAPSFWAIGGKAANLAFAVPFRLPGIFAVTLLLQSGLIFAVFLFEENSVFAFVLKNIVWWVLLAPWTIAVHRYVLLGETRFWAVFRSIGRIARFAAWLVVWPWLWLLIPLAVSAVSLPVAYALVLVCFLIAIVVFTRLLLLFPAIAIDASKRPARYSLVITRNHVWKMIGSLAVLLLFLKFLAFLIFEIGILLAVFFFKCCATGIGYVPVFHTSTDLTSARVVFAGIASVPDSVAELVLAASGAALASLLFNQYGTLPRTANPASDPRETSIPEPGPQPA